MINKIAILLLACWICSLHGAQLQTDPRDGSIKGNATLIDVYLKPGGWTSLATEPGLYRFRSGLSMYLMPGTYRVSGMIGVSAKKIGSTISIRGVMPSVEIDMSNDINHVPAKPEQLSVMGTSVVGSAEFKTKISGVDVFGFDFGKVNCQVDQTKMQMCELTLDAWTDDPKATVLGRNSSLRVIAAP